MICDNRDQMSMNADELGGHHVKPAKARIAIALCSLVIMTLLFATACSKPLTSVGGFSIEENSAYEVRESNPMSTMVADGGRELQHCDAIVVAKGHEEECAVGAVWYGGASFDEAKTYLSDLDLNGAREAEEQPGGRNLYNEETPGQPENVPSGTEEAVAQDGALDSSQEASGYDDASRRPDLSSPWATTEKKVVDKRDITLEGGIPAFLYVWETTTELGQPYACMMTQVVFPTGEDSVGWVGYTAFSEEQMQVDQTLLDEVLKYIVID